jgi:hypothetical protein
MELLASGWEALAGFVAGFAIFMLIIIILIIIGSMRVFKKAGKPMWAAIIPIYSTYVLLQIIRKPVWWMVPLIVLPILDSIVDMGMVGNIISLICFVFVIMALYNLAKVFGRGIGFALGLIILNPIFMMILGFGKSEYQGGVMPTVSSTPTPTPTPTV